MAQISGSPQKLQDLTLNKKYFIMEISNPIKTKFGNSYILQVSLENEDGTFELWASKVLKKYIEERERTDKFYFIVKEMSDGVKFGEIENRYSPNFTRVAVTRADGGTVKKATV